MFRSLRTPLVLAAALVVLAACGGKAEGISKNDFLKQANTICKTSTAAAEQLGSQVPDSASTTEKIRVTEEQLDVFQKQFEQVRALGYPEGDEKTLKAMYHDAEQSIDAIKAAVTPVKEKSSPSVVPDIDKRLTAYGLTDCTIN